MKCPYSPGDLTLNLEGVPSWTKAPRQQSRSIWDPPPPKMLKWNVDGSAKGKLGPAGISGILRDEIRRVIANFAASVGIRDSNEADVPSSTICP